MNTVFDIIVVATVSFLLGFHFGSRAAFRAVRKALDEHHRDGGPHA